MEFNEFDQRRNSKKVLLVSLNNLFEQGCAEDLRHDKCITLLLGFNNSTMITYYGSPHFEKKAAHQVIQFVGIQGKIHSCGCLSEHLSGTLKICSWSLSICNNVEVWLPTHIWPMEYFICCNPWTKAKWGLPFPCILEDQRK